MTSHFGVRLETPPDLVTGLIAALAISVVGGIFIIRYLVKSRALARGAADAAGQRAERIQDSVAGRETDYALAQAELERFVYVASHDLVEPLRTISNYSQLVKRKLPQPLDAEIKELLDFIHDGASRMWALVDSLLAFSRAGDGETPRERTDLVEPWREAVRHHSDRLSELRARVDNDPLPTVLADPGQMVELFRLLLDNSIKFRGSEPLVVDCSSTRTKDWVEITVADNGIGVEGQYRERVFQVFERLHPRGQYTGIGMGLAIARRIVENHGGRIWIDETAGGGTTVHFTIANRRGGPTGPPPKPPEPPSKGPAEPASGEAGVLGVPSGVRRVVEDVETSV